mgnify:FL=1
MRLEFDITLTAKDMFRFNLYQTYTGASGWISVIAAVVCFAAAGTKYSERGASYTVLGILLGAGMTLVVQSSSATIAVLQNFASQAGPDGVTSVIGLTGAIPILLGDNIGTTITALLASIGQSKNAKRTALAHSVFNITGSIVFLFLIPLLAVLYVLFLQKGRSWM